MLDERSTVRSSFPKYDPPPGRTTLKIVPAEDHFDAYCRFHVLNKRKKSLKDI